MNFRSSKWSAKIVDEDVLACLANARFFCLDSINDAYLLSVNVPTEHHARFGRRRSALDVHKVTIPIALSDVEQLQATLGQHWWRRETIH